MDLPMFTPPQIAEKLGDVCQGKCRTPMKKFFVLAILAGAFIAFGAQLSIIVGSDATLGFGFTKFIAGAVFSVGLMLVVVAGAELFTGDNLIVISALEKKVRWGELLKTWIAVYLGNLIGSVMIALLLYWSGLWSMNGNLVGAAALKIAGSKVGLTFVQGLVRGVLCNWLVCLAVWMATSSKDVIGKLFAVFFPVMAFVASGFEHSVANMFFIPYGILLKSVPKVVEATGKTLADYAGLNWATLWTKNLIPVTIGNIIGGAFFVGIVYWFVYLKKAPETLEAK
ncbi:MAG: formate/nitrite transporter family protein [Caldiserica bacterium]|nr:formate/nitrite transporter family protein [Caldisericota bacterium]